MMQRKDWYMQAFMKVGTVVFEDFFSSFFFFLAISFYDYP